MGKNCFTTGGAGKMRNNKYIFDTGYSFSMPASPKASGIFTPVNGGTFPGSVLH
jgi:hypothetical protein